MHIIKQAFQFIQSYARYLWFFLAIVLIFLFVVKFLSKKTIQPLTTITKQPLENTSTPSPIFIPSITISVHASATPTRQPVSTIATIINATENIAQTPEEYYISGVSSHKQFFSLGCETATAIDWAFFFNLSINEFEFQHRLPLSDNPEKGFVGSVDGPWGQVPPYAYGVHAKPIAQLLNEYGLPQARAVKGLSIEELKIEIAQNQPVIAWVIGNCVGGVPFEYTDSTGEKVIVAAYEHVIIITGYNKERIRYLNNGRTYEVPNDVFENSWSILGNMALIFDD